MLIAPQRKQLNLIRQRQKEALRCLGLQRCVHTLFIGKVAWGFGFLGDFLQPLPVRGLARLLAWPYRKIVGFYEDLGHSRLHLLWKAALAVALISIGVFSGQFLVDILDSLFNLADQIEPLLEQHSRLQQ